MTAASPKRAGHERLGFVDLAVHLPVGVVVSMIHDVPAVVARGRAQVRQDVAVARFLGKMAVEQGRRVARSRIESRLDGTALRPKYRDRGTTSVVGTAAPTVPASDGASDSSDGSDLPIHGYDELAAQQILERLGVLRPDELDVIESYERNNRRRRTILGRIEQLREGPDR